MRFTRTRLSFPSNPCVLIWPTPWPVEWAQARALAPPVPHFGLSRRSREGPPIARVRRSAAAAKQTTQPLRPRPPFASPPSPRLTAQPPPHPPCQLPYNGYSRTHQGFPVCVFVAPEHALVGRAPYAGSVPHAQGRLDHWYHRTGWVLPCRAFAREGLRRARNVSWTVDWLSLVGLIVLMAGWCRVVSVGKNRG